MERRPSFPTAFAIHQFERHTFAFRSLTKACIILLLTLICNIAFPQSEIPVNMYTGQPSIGIPITAITSHDISVAVTLSYDVNNSDPKSIAGYGWTLNAGGSVSREVRGLPDDFGYTGTRKGWLFEKQPELTVSQDVANFVQNADITAIDFTGEAMDHAWLDARRADYDLEPDIFHYNFSGISGSFVFGNDQLIHTIPYRDIKIDPTFDVAGDRKILSFVITTNDGFKYTFGKVATATRSASKNQYLNQVNFLTTDFEYYDVAKGGATYSSQWYLTRIDSPNGAYINFTYGPGLSEPSDIDVNVGYYKTLDPFYADPTDLEVRNIYKIHQTSTRYHPSEITGSTGERVVFRYDTDRLTKIDVIDLRKGGANDVANLVKSVELRYENIDYQSKSGSVAYTRSFLSSVTEVSGCDRMPPIVLSYSGFVRKKIGSIDYAWGTVPSSMERSNNIPKVYIYPDEPPSERYRLNKIPVPTGPEYILKGVDWIPNTPPDGILESITYPQGGKVRFAFGGNNYLDSRTNETLPASGFRINAITYFDGFNATPVTKIFTYGDPTTGKSSGRLLRKPVLAFPAYKWKDPYNQNSSNAIHEKTYDNLMASNVEEAWKYLTIRTESPVTPSELTQGNSVGYTFVKVSRPGAGSATFEYRVPGISSEYTNGDWVSTVNRFARSTLVPMGVVSTAGPWTYPHAPNPTFDFERGLLWRKSDYNEAGKLVQQTETTYQSLHKASAPVKVWGVRYDRYALAEDREPTRRIYFYGKYFLLTDTDKVPKTEKITTYNINDASNTKFVVESTRYVYDSTSHKMLVQVKHTASDGTVRSTRFKYPKDYANVTTNAEDAVLMLSHMQTNFKHGAPVETITTLQRPGGAERVTGATLIKFKTFISSHPLPESIWSLRTGSTINIDSFKISSVQLLEGVNKLDMDTRYVMQSSFSAYTYNGQNITAKDETSRISASTFYSASTMLPVVQLKNASASQVAFSDFENTTGIDFTSATPYFGAGRTGVNAFYPGVALQKTVTRAPVDEYVLSFWIKSNATVDFSVVVKHTSGAPVYSTTPISVPASGGTNFKYVQKVIPVTSVPSGDFIVTLQAPFLTVPPAGGSAPGLLPVIDDVFFYPINASMASMDYAIPFGISTVTTATGEASHTVYDKLGRPKYLKDRDLNIVKRTSYNFHTDPDLLIADFAVPLEVIIGQRALFEAGRNSCLSDVTYAWNFGGGFVQGSDTTSFISNTPGWVTVTLKVTHPIHGERILAKTFEVKLPPVTVEICAKGVMEYNATSASVTQAYSCTQITATPPTFGTIFRVSTSTGCEYGGCTFTWKLKELGGFSWATVGTGLQYTVQKVVPATKSFLVMCEIDSPRGIVTSTPLQVTITE
jgi:hypothetical protein